MMYRFFTRDNDKVRQVSQEVAQEDMSTLPNREAARHAEVLANDWGRRVYYAPAEVNVESTSDKWIFHVDPEVFRKHAGNLRPFEQRMVDAFDNLMAKFELLEKRLVYLGKGVFTRDEAAEYLGISVRALHEERKARRIKAAQLTKSLSMRARVGYLRVECDRWLADRVEKDPTKEIGVDPFLKPAEPVEESTSPEDLPD